MNGLKLYGAAVLLNILFLSSCLLAVYLGLRIFYYAAADFAGNPLVQTIESPEKLMENIEVVSSMQSAVSMVRLWFFAAFVAFLAIFAAGLVLFYSGMLRVLAGKGLFDGFGRMFVFSVVYAICLFTPFFASFYAGRTFFPATVFFTTVAAAFIITPVVFVSKMFKIQYIASLLAFLKSTPVAVLLFILCFSLLFFLGNAVSPIVFVLLVMLAFASSTTWLHMNALEVLKCAHR